MFLYLPIVDALRLLSGFKARFCHFFVSGIVTVLAGGRVGLVGGNKLDGFVGGGMLSGFARDGILDGLVGGFGTRLLESR